MLISHPASNSRLRSFAKQKGSGRCGYERQDSNSMCETPRMPCTTRQRLWLFPSGKAIPLMEVLGLRCVARSTFHIRRPPYTCGPTGQGKITCESGYHLHDTEGVPRPTHYWVQAQTVIFNTSNRTLRQTCTRSPSTRSSYLPYPEGICRRRLASQHLIYVVSTCHSVCEDI
jgi:hypothetical protein